MKWLENIILYKRNPLNFFSLANMCGIYIYIYTEKTHGRATRTRTKKTKLCERNGFIMFELEMSLNIIAEGYEKAWPLYLYFMEMTSDFGQRICRTENKSDG